MDRIEDISLDRVLENFISERMSDANREIAELLSSRPAPETYVCPVCGAMSYNPNDIRERYCGRCHQYESDVNMNLDLELARMLRTLQELPTPEMPDVSWVTADQRIVPVDEMDDGHLVNTIRMLMLTNRVKERRVVFSDSGESTWHRTKWLRHLVKELHRRAREGVYIMPQ